LAQIKINSAKHKEWFKYKINQDLLSSQSKWAYLANLKQYVDIDSLFLGKLTNDNSNIVLLPFI
jgi:hypothetical protein